jgi:hypothetical protein
VRWILAVLICVVGLLSASPTSERYVVDGRVTWPVQTILRLSGIHCSDRLDQVVQVTQKEWLRKGERWELEDSLAQKTLRQFYLPLFRELGLLHPRVSNRAEARYGVWLGCMLDVARQRLMTMARAWDAGLRFEQLVILTGDRPLDSQLESLEKLYAPSRGFSIRDGWQQPAQDPVNETEMMLMILDQAEIPDQMREQLIIVDAPRDGKPRPNTADTFWCWLDEEPEPGAAIAFSNQPYVDYQQLIGEAILPEEIRLETVGAAASHKVQVSLLLDTLARILYAIQATEIL